MDNTYYIVKSQSGNGTYDVIATELGWTCSCPDHVHRGVKCKHIYAVEFSLAIRSEVEASVVKEITSVSCIPCNSDRIVKKAKRYNDHGTIQRYLCKICGKRFSFNIGFEKMKHNPQGVTTAIATLFQWRIIKEYCSIS